MHETDIVGTNLVVNGSQMLLRLGCSSRSSGMKDRCLSPPLKVPESTWHVGDSSVTQHGAILRVKKYLVSRVQRWLSNS